MERLLTSTRHRVVLYDELRGLMILSMLVYHLCYDLAELVELPGMGWFDSAAADVWQLSICGTFLLISGACCTFSRSNLRRGLRLLGLGILLTVVTALFVPDQLIVFGLLHFLGVAVLLTTLLKPLLERIPTAGGIVGMLVLFLLTDHLYDGWFGLTPQLSIALPDACIGATGCAFWAFTGRTSFPRTFFRCCRTCSCFGQGCCSLGFSCLRGAIVLTVRRLPFSGGIPCGFTCSTSRCCTPSFG